MLEKVTLDFLDSHYNQWNNTGSPNAPRKAYMDADGTRQISGLDTYEFELMGIDWAMVSVVGEDKREAHSLRDFAYIEPDVSLNAMHKKWRGNFTDEFLSQFVEDDDA